MGFRGVVNRVGDFGRCDGAVRPSSSSSLHTVRTGAEKVYAILKKKKKIGLLEVGPKL